MSLMQSLEEPTRTPDHEVPMAAQGQEIVVARDTAAERVQHMFLERVVFPVHTTLQVYPSHMTPRGELTPTVSPSFSSCFTA
ncbi:MAG: hypothetical protein CV088_18525 [Nitrospira sp. LK70]|nr:hypothetical protein [Nitrospira sp. LK70]